MPEAKIWCVSEINSLVREVLEQSFYPMWVTGEVGNLTIHRSGHVYMTLKDASAQLRAVFFSGAASCRALDLRTGDRVEVLGRLSLYQSAGEFQLNVRSIRRCGVGDLQQRFEELKRKLDAEGLFDPARKRKIPYPPRHIGLITSPSGAAVKDFLKIALRRFPNLDIRIFPAAVQGRGAEHELARGIRFFNRTGAADVIVLTRGGGSLEELWAFNEEELARAIAESAIPVVSAVGHEIDFTIADFTADLRAPTPSAAAEMLVPEKSALERDLRQFRIRSAHALELAYQRAQARLERMRKSLGAGRVARLVADRRQYVDFCMKRMETAADNQLSRVHAKLEKLRSVIDLCDVSNTLGRGFALLSPRPGNGRLVKTAADAKTVRKMTARFVDGTVDVDAV